MHERVQPQPNGKPIRLAHAIARSVRLSLPLLLLPLLAGCGAMGGMTGGTSANLPPAQASLPPARPADPLAAFAARAQNGQQEMVATAAGAPVPVRAVRSYNAASGRVCRELAVGSGIAARPALYCGDEAGGWSAARPLLRGGAVARP